MYMGRKGGYVYGTVGARIDGNIKVGKDIIGMGPPVEGEPVVGSDDKHKLLIWIVGLEMLQRVPRIGRLGEVELVIGGFEARLTEQGTLREEQSLVIVEQVCRRLLEGVEGRHKEPHLVQMGEAQQFTCDGDMTHVDGVETATKDSDTRLHAKIVVVHTDIFHTDVTYFTRILKILPLFT